MTEMTACVRNVNGIHVRPSDVIIRHIADYPGEVRVTSSNGESDLRSILELLTLALEKGAEVAIRVNGPNEESVCQELVDLFQKEFDFPPQD